MTRGRVRDPQVERLRALLPVAPTSAPRIPAARPRDLGPLARIVAQLSGRLTNGPPPNIFTTLGQHQRLFRGWLQYSARLMPFGLLPRRDTELLILGVAWHCGSVYEWRQHVPLALRAGLGPEQIGAIARDDFATGFSDRQRALLSLCNDLLAHRAMAESSWHDVRAILNDREVIEACLLVGHYEGLASAIGGLAIEPEYREW